MANGTRGGRAGRRRSRGSGIRRLAGLAAFLPLASRAPLYARLVWSLVLDERTPPARKAVLAAALGYLVVGRDIVPDDLPFVGGLDDVIVVVLAVDVFLDGIPNELLMEKLAELDIDEREFKQDLVRIRRLTPGPVRRLVRRLPGTVDAMGDMLKQSGLGPRVRAWITREDPIT